jgi:G3E family GTPase
LLTLVSGGSYAQREAAIAASLLKLPKDETIAVVLEGLPTGTNVLFDGGSLRVHRIAPGCMCCIGNLAMRVTLNRIFRLSPSYLFISLSSAEHLEKVMLFLQQPVYANLLELKQNLQLAT